MKATFIRKKAKIFLNQITMSTLTMLNILIESAVTRKKTQTFQSIQSIHPIAKKSRTITRRGRQDIIVIIFTKETLKNPVTTKMNRHSPPMTFTK
ncbi:hypothetical protein OSTOST_16699 [Ostertagia ostertagi]